MSYDSNTQGASQTYDCDHGLVTSSWDNVVSHGQPTQRKHAHPPKTRQATPNYQTFPSSTEFHYAMPGAYLTPVCFSSLRNQSYAYGCGGFKIPQGFYSPTHLLTSTDIDHMSSVASSPATGTGSENPPDELQVSDEVFAQIKADIIYLGVVLRIQRQAAANLVSRKRRDPPDPDLGATNQVDTRRRKKRRTREGDETGVRQAAQRGETRELPIEGTPRQANQISKLGRGLDMETLVATQGVSSSLALGPTIAGATPGSHEFASQAWMEGTGGKSGPQEKVGTEDAHDEEETDKERWERLMRHADGVWSCAGCGGRTFSARCTLQRHCRSAVHGKQRDKQKCPVCSKEYQHLGHLTRHMDQKHKGAVKPKEGKGLL